MASKEITGSQVEEENAETEASEPEDPKAALAKVIKVKVKDAGVLRKALNITVPRESIDKELDKEYKELINEAIVPGFRRGRAPRRLIEKRFGGEVGAQVQTRIVSNAYLAAVEKEDLKVLGDPMLWVADPKIEAKEGNKEKLVDMPTYLQQVKLPAEGEFELRCEVEVKPEFTLPGLDGVEVEKPKLTITDEDLDVQIDRIRARRGQWIPQPDGKVEKDDMLICDMKVSAGGKEIKHQENMQLAARPQLIEGVTFEDLGDKVNGAKIGDVRKLEGDLPEDYEVQDLRGKKATFEFTINDIKRLHLPEMNDEFLSTQGFDSKKEFRDWVREQMESELDHEIKRGMRNQVRKYLLDNTKLDLPEGLSSRTIARAVVRRMIDLQRQGVPMAEIEKHADELKTSASDAAITDLKLHFILEDIAEKLEIEVTEEEINGQIAGIAQMYNRRFDRVRDELMKNNGIESLYLQIRDDKCIDQILEKAKVVEAKVDKPAPKAKAEKPKAGAKEKVEEKKAPAKPAKKEEEAEPKAKAPKPAAAKEKPAEKKPTKKK